MTPEERQQFKDLLAWKAERETNQISSPLDDTSRLVLRAITTQGLGSSALTQTISTSGATATVPSAYVSSVIIETPDGRFEIPAIKII